MVICIVGVLWSISLLADENFVSGPIKDISSTPIGVLVRIDDPDTDGPHNVPGVCGTVAGNWLIVKEENRSMLSVLMLAWTQNKDAGMTKDA